MTGPLDETRDYMRFKPEPTEYASIQLDSNASEFKADLIGLIVDESPKSGCGLVIQPFKGLGNKSECRIQLGSLKPVKAQVVRVEDMAYGLQCLGINFLE